MQKLYGVTTAMLTPMDSGGAVDLQQTRKLTDFLIQRGVDCLYPLGTNGEMLKLTVPERQAIAEAVVQQAAGRVTVYVHVGAATTADTIALAQHAQQIGAQGVGVVSPQYFFVNDREMEEFYVEVAQSVPDFPLYMYAIPQMAVNDVQPAVAAAVADRCSNVIGVKYSYPDFHRTHEFLQTGLSVLQGADGCYLEALAIGCDGVISGTSSVYPEPFVAMKRQYEKGELDNCRDIMHIIGLYRDALQSGRNLEFAKAALRYRGLDIGSVRKPGLPLTQAETTELYDTLTALDEAYMTQLTQWSE